MSNVEFYSNDVNETGAISEGVASCRCSVQQQRRPGRQPVTAVRRLKRLAWSKEVTKRLFKCYIKSEPERTGHRKRLLGLWKTRKTNDEVTEVTEKRPADHVRQIKDKKWLATVKQEEIALRVNIEHQQVETTEPSTTETLHHVARTPDIQEEKC